MTVRPPLAACEQVGGELKQAHVGVAGQEAGSSSHVAEVVCDALVIRQYSAWI